MTVALTSKAKRNDEPLVSHDFNPVDHLPLLVAISFFYTALLLQKK
jgi:hypothetical protein